MRVTHPHLFTFLPLYIPTILYYGIPDKTRLDYTFVGSGQGSYFPQLSLAVVAAAPGLGRRRPVAALELREVRLEPGAGSFNLKDLQNQWPKIMGYFQPIMGYLGVCWPVILSNLVFQVMGPICVSHSANSFTGDGIGAV